MVDQSTATCSACGYSLRGLASDHCPECGKAVQRKLVFLDRGQFEAAERALRTTGIAFQSLDSDRGLGNIIAIEYGMMDRKHILIDRTRFDEAMKVFQDHNIHFPLPVVDRSEPNCPNCGIAFDGSVESRCPNCRTEFEWIDVDDTLLTDDSPNRPSARVASSSWWHKTPRRIGIVILLFIIISVAWSVIGVALSIDSVSSGVGLLLAIVIFSAIIVATVRRQP